MESKVEYENLQKILEQVATNEKWGYDSFYEWENGHHDYGEIKIFIWDVLKEINKI